MSYLNTLCVLLLGSVSALGVAEAAPGAASMDAGSTPPGPTERRAEKQAPGLLVVNELDVNQAGDPENGDFVEIRNSGETSLALGDYNLVHLAYNWWTLRVDRRLRLPDIQLSPGAYFVLCRPGSTVDRCDFEGLFPLNDGNGVVAISYNVGDDPSQDHLVDSFAYGQHYADGLPDPPENSAWVEGDPMPETDGRNAIDAPLDVGYSRSCDGRDLDNNAMDFRLLATTPGLANITAENVAGCAGCGCDDDGATFRCCSGNGQCLGRGATVACQCDEGFFGPTCAHPDGALFPLEADDFPPSCNLQNNCAADAAATRRLAAAAIGEGIQCSFSLEGGTTWDLPNSLWHPADENGDWLQGPLPLVVISHGAWNPFSTLAPHDYTQYDFLQQHLAANGFVVASVGTNTFQANGDEFYGTRESARQAILSRYLDCLRADPTVAPHLGLDSVLLGHSTGGEGALLLARELAAMPDPPHTISAIVALAPSHNSANAISSGQAVELCDDATAALLVLGASRDGDIDGNPINLYGLASLPDAQGRTTHLDPETGLYSCRLPDVPIPPMTKSLVWIDRAFHNGFLETQEPPLPGLFSPTTMHPEAHRQLLKAYVTAFLRWHIYGDTEYREYFDGTITSAVAAAADDPDGPGGEAPRPVRITTELVGPGRDHLLKFLFPGLRSSIPYTGRVVDHFEPTTRTGPPNGLESWEVSTFAESALEPAKDVFAAGAIDVEEIRFPDIVSTGDGEDSFRHVPFRGLLVDWSDRSASIEYRLSGGRDPQLDTLCYFENDLRPFSDLTLRVGQVWNSGGNGPPPPDDPTDPLYARSLDFSVELSSFRTAADPPGTQLVRPRVAVSSLSTLFDSSFGEDAFANPSFANIPYADPAPALSDQFSVDLEVNSVMQTLRVPLETFCKAENTGIGAPSDLQGAFGLRFLFDRQDSGTAVFDDLRLITDPSKPPAIRHCISDVVVPQDCRDQGFLPRRIIDEPDTLDGAGLLLVRDGEDDPSEIRCTLPRILSDTDHRLFLTLDNHGVLPASVEARVYFWDWSTEPRQWRVLSGRGAIPEAGDPEARIEPGERAIRGPVSASFGEPTKPLKIRFGEGDFGILLVAVQSGEPKTGVLQQDGPVFFQPQSCVEAWDELRTLLSLDNNYAALWVDLR